MVQCVGAVVVFFAARMCHAAFVTSIDVWFSSPANRFKYYKGFREKYRKTGKADYSMLMKTHPETISETFGDESTSEGQMVKALVLPSTVIMAIGGIMMRCGGSDMWGYIWHAARGLLTPFGLLMVLQTPVVSGASGGNVAIREGKAVSNIELLYQMNWVTLHMLGFISFLGPAVLIELPIAVMELLDSDGIQQSWEGDACLQNSRIVLAAMRAVCAVLLLFAAPFLGKSKTRNPNTLSALKWRAEFTVGEFGATQMYFNALSVWLQPGVGPYSWVDIAFLSLFALEAFRIFFVHALWTLLLMPLCCAKSCFSCSALGTVWHTEEIQVPLGLYRLEVRDQETSDSTRPRDVGPAGGHQQRAQLHACGAGRPEGTGNWGTGQERSGERDFLSVAHRGV